MKVRVLTSLAGERNHQYGDVVELDDEQAVGLIEAGQGEPVRDLPSENAAAPTGEKAVVQLGSLTAGVNVHVDPEFVEYVKQELAKIKADAEQSQAANTPATDLAVGPTLSATTGRSESSESAPAAESVSTNA